MLRKGRNHHRLACAEVVGFLEGVRDVGKSVPSYSAAEGNVAMDLLCDGGKIELGD